MLQERNLQERIQTNELKMRELAINLDKLDREYQKLLAELGLTYEQIQSYISNQDNFSQPIWERLQNQKKKIDEKLVLAVEGVKDPESLQKKFSEIAAIQKHWLFVR